MLEVIQEKLQRLYDLDQMPDVLDFLVSSMEIEKLSLSKRPQVLLLQENQEVHLGIYFGEELLKRIHQNQCSFDDYNVLIEEVSHFLYLFWNITHQQSVNLLDIEIQGEIDKFLLLTDQLGFSETLTEKLFGKYLLRPNLAKEETNRYHRANQLAKRFAHQILKMNANPSQIVSYVRKFYRRGSFHRISQIQKMPL